MSRLYLCSENDSVDSFFCILRLLAAGDDQVAAVEQEHDDLGHVDLVDPAGELFPVVIRALPDDGPAFQVDLPPDGLRCNGVLDLNGLFR